MMLKELLLIKFDDFWMCVWMCKLNEWLIVVELVKIESGLVVIGLAVGVG